MAYFSATGEILKYEKRRKAHATILTVNLIKGKE